MKVQEARCAHVSREKGKIGEKCRCTAFGSGEFLLRCYYCGHTIEVHEGVSIKAL